MFCAIAENRPPREAPAFRLDRNYPNPFNPATTIPYEIFGGGGPAGGVSVALEVYDVTGRRVRSLVRGARSPGAYRAVWRGDTDGGARAASGVYFARLQVGSNVETVKMILVE
jgi:hypothetical protein